MQEQNFAYEDMFKRVDAAFGLLDMEGMENGNPFLRLQNKQVHCQCIFISRLFVLIFFFVLFIFPFIISFTNQYLSI